MPKIELLDKVKCWRCGGYGKVTEFAKPWEGRPDVTPDTITYDCDCDDGERYVFDDLAAKVREAGFDVDLTHYCADEIPGPSQVTLVAYSEDGDSEAIAHAVGPTPTAAILEAILKFNERE